MVYDGFTALAGELVTKLLFQDSVDNSKFCNFPEWITIFNKGIFIIYIDYLAALPLVLEMVHVFVWEANGLQRQREFKRKKKILLEVKTLLDISTF